MRSKSFHRRWSIGRNYGADHTFYSDFARFSVFWRVETVRCRSYLLQRCLPGPRGLRNRNSCLHSSRTSTNTMLLNCAWGTTGCFAKCHSSPLLDFAINPITVEQYGKCKIMRTVTKHTSDIEMGPYRSKLLVLHQAND